MIKIQINTFSKDFKDFASLEKYVNTLSKMKNPDFLLSHGQEKILTVEEALRTKEAE